MNITIYTKRNCPNCVAAKQLLKSKGLEYSEINIDEGPVTRESFMSAYPEARQMPQIFVNGHRIGGLEGLRANMEQILKVQAQ